MKTKLFIFLFLAGSIIPNLLFAQFMQQGPKLVGTGSVGGPQQGQSVAISSDGNTAIVGGPYDNSGTGAVWIYIRSGGIWTQQGSKIIGTGAVAIANQGWSVAISSDGNTAIIGGAGDNSLTGAVWIFTRSGGVWTQQGPKLVGTGAIGNSVQGQSVGISSDGNTAIAGGYRDNGSIGAVWVFTRSGGVWTQQGQKLAGTGAAGIAWQGWSVAISSDGNTIIEGGPIDNTNTGAVWVFTRSGGVWTQQGQKLIGTGAIGSPQNGVSVGISSDGNTAIEGGNFDNSHAGAMWVFNRSGGVWTQQGTKLVGTGTVGSSIEQGWSVSISSNGNNAVLSGPLDNSYAGAIWVFTRNSGVWTQQGTKLVGTGTVGADRQGYSVAISSDGGTVIEGGLGDNSNVGAVWVFANPSIGITPISTEIPKNFSLSQNYPNPFNPNTVIKFQVIGYRLVKLSIYDILGREVSTIVNEQLQPGTYEVDFDGSNYSSGLYFYKLEAGGFTETKKMLMIK